MFCQNCSTGCLTASTCYLIDVSSVKITKNSILKCTKYFYFIFHCRKVYLCSNKSTTFLVLKKVYKICRKQLRTDALSINAVAIFLRSDQNRQHWSIIAMETPNLESTCLLPVIVVLLGLSGRSAEHKCENKL